MDKRGESGKLNARENKKRYELPSQDKWITLDKTRLCCCNIFSFIHTVGLCKVIEKMDS